jgi:hypothetical protein
MLPLVFIMAGCASSPQSDKAHSYAGKPFFDGDGREGLVIAVLQPKGVNIPKGLSWYLSMIQGSLTGDFNRFSNITVLDRQHLDTVLEEQNLSLSGDFSDDDYIRIGNLTNAQYILTGSLTQTASMTFLLELALTNPETGERKASFGPKVYSRDNIQSMYAAKEAADSLLTQIGVELTGAGRDALYEAARDLDSVQAETALAKGVTAQNSAATPKTTFEAMYYLYEAQSLDPSLLEAAERLEAYQAAIFIATEITIPELSAPVQTGNIGQDARNEIAQYKARRETIQLQQEYLLGQRMILLDQQETLLDKQWELIALLNESEDFYKSNPPFEIIYDTALERTGELNFQTETINLQFRIATTGVPASLKVIQSILDSLETMRQGFVSINAGLDKIQEQLGRVNEAGKEYAVAPVSGVQADDKILGYKWAVPQWTAGEGRTFAIEAALTGKEGKRIGTANVFLFNEIYGYNYTEPENAAGTGVFKDVPVNDIGDVLKITIETVNGVDIEDPDNAGYIKISPITGAGYTAGGYDIYGFNKAGRDPFGYDRQGYDKAGRDREGYNKAGYDRNGRDRYGLTHSDEIRFAINKHFDDSRKDGFSLFTTIDPFPPDFDNAEGIFLGFGLDIFIAHIGFWGEFEFFLGKLYPNYYWSSLYSDYDGDSVSDGKYFRYSFGLNLSVFPHITLDAGIVWEQKPIVEKISHSMSSPSYIYEGFEDPVLNMVRAGITWFIGYGGGFTLLAHANYNFDSDLLSFVFGIGIGLW